MSLGACEASRRHRPLSTLPSLAAPHSASLALHLFLLPSLTQQYVCSISSPSSTLQIAERTAGCLSPLLPHADSECSPTRLEGPSSPMPHPACDIEDRSIWTQALTSRIWAHARSDNLPPSVPKQAKHTVAVSGGCSHSMHSQAVKPHGCARRSLQPSPALPSNSRKRRFGSHCHPVATPAILHP